MSKGHRTCEACGIRERHDKNSLLFSSFPLEPIRCRVWLKLVGKEDLVYLPIEKLNKTRNVCANHFEKKYFNKKGNRLKRNAIPTLNLIAAPLAESQLGEFPLHLYQPTDPKDVLPEAEPSRNHQSRSILGGCLKVFASNQADSAGATEQPSKTEELQYQPSTSMTEELQYQPSTSMAEELQYQPSISTAEELQHQPFKYSMNAALQLQEVILIKEEITDEEKKQCRLCLSIGRRMKELGEYAHLYRKLLVENNYQNTTIASFMYQMLACWECHAELRRVKRFQDRVRRANNVFETNQNRNCETLSNLSTILIGEYKKSEEEEEESEKLSRVEECAQDIKEEAVEVEVEEISLPDPLEFNQEDRRARWVERNLDIQNEPNKSVLTQKVMRRPKPEPKTAENVPKRVKLGQRVYSGPKRLKLDHSGPKTSKGQENDEIFTKETDPEAIFGKVQIEINELVKILEERRNIESFRNMTFKCDSCILGFTNHNRLLEHNRNFHNQEFGTSECAICERRFTDERRLSAHYRGHFAKFVCKLCNYECYTKTGRAIHFKRHKGVSQGDSVSLRQRHSDQGASASESSRGSCS
ncbi:uncharacterized protein [Maniola hyperantus]|uniref:uncharacterized protein isoform X3 n=1 Tax=Aphantopus hyperantus TaxID=2795564 RepID=UPI003747E5A1